MKNVSKIMLSFALLTIGFLPAQMATAAARQDDTSAKQDMKDAGHSTKRAAKKTGSATKKTTKKAAHKTAKKTEQGAQKVEDKTNP